jgi:hypothetical protein
LLLCRLTQDGNVIDMPAEAEAATLGGGNVNKALVAEAARAKKDAIKAAHEVCALLPRVRDGLVET